MKNALVSLALAAGALAAPVLSFAQSTAPVSRAEVRADLVQLEKAGYNVSAGDDASYPAGIQAAEAKVTAQDAAQASASAQQGYGGMPQSGASSAGKNTRMPEKSACVGPASFCNVFFGS